MKVYHGSYDLLRRASSVFNSRYSPKRADVIAINLNDFSTNQLTKAAEDINNNPSNSIGKSFTIADISRKIDFMA